MFRQSSLADCCTNRDFSVVRGDCRDKRILPELVPKLDVLIPLAALAGAPLCERDATGTLTTNRGAVRFIASASLVSGCGCSPEHLSRYSTY
jgi:FlaA1/EpsC-like NDP-sugar epimerase